MTRAAGKRSKPVVAEFCVACDRGDCSHCARLVHGADVCIHACRDLTAEERRDALDRGVHELASRFNRRKQ